MFIAISAVGTEEGSASHPDFGAIVWSTQHTAAVAPGGRRSNGQILPILISAAGELTGK